MTEKNIKLFTITSFIVIFLISLTQNAIVVSKDFHNENVSSINLFFSGAFGWILGGLLESIIWLANPFAFLTIIFLWKNKRNAMFTVSASLFLAICVLFWNEILQSGSGRNDEIEHLDKGYYLWLLSIIVLAIGTFLYFKKINGLKNKF